MIQFSLASMEAVLNSVEDIIMFGCLPTPQGAVLTSLDDRCVIQFSLASMEAAFNSVDDIIMLGLLLTSQGAVLKSVDGRDVIRFSLLPREQSLILRTILICLNFCYLPESGP